MYSAIKTIERYKMLSKNDIVVVAVSGGPDSMALLHLLLSLRDEYSLTLHAAHLNHMLRGDEADEDTKYVTEYCRRIGVPCTARYVDIEKLAEECKLSVEEAGRKARYSLFSDVADEIGATKIALAHNMNDQAETILMRVMRGTGLDGLCGIKPIRDGIYIRPLLHTERSDIEKYCADNDIRPRIDSTNLEPVYTRNRVRLELLPYIKEHLNSNVEHSLSSMTEVLREDNDFINIEAEKAYGCTASLENDRVSINISVLKNWHPAIKRRVIRKAVERIKGNLEGIESRHIDLILSMADKNDTGSAVELPGKIIARISYNNLEVMPRIKKCSEYYCTGLSIPGSTDISEIDAVVEVKIISISSLYNEGGNDKAIRMKDRDGSVFIKYFDYDKLKTGICIRPRQEGDYIVPLGMRGRKKIKDLFIDSKIPRDKRDEIPLVAVGKEIVWVIGYNISENYKIDKNTKSVLRIELKQSGGKNNVK